MDSKPRFIKLPCSFSSSWFDPYRLHLCEFVFSLTSWSSSLSAKDLRVCIGSSSLSSFSPLLVDTNHSHRASSTILHLLQFPSWLCVSSSSQNQARAQVSTVNLHLISVVEGPIPSSNPLRRKSCRRVSSAPPGQALFVFINGDVSSFGKLGPLAFLFLFFFDPRTFGQKFTEPVTKMENQTNKTT